MGHWLADVHLAGFAPQLVVGWCFMFGQASFAWSWLEGSLQTSIFKYNMESKAFFLALT
jgi:hypothetical protein